MSYGTEPPLGLRSVRRQLDWHTHCHSLMDTDENGEVRSYGCLPQVTVHPVGGEGRCPDGAVRPFWERAEVLSPEGSRPMIENHSGTGG